MHQATRQRTAGPAIGPGSGHPRLRALDSQGTTSPATWGFDCTDPAKRTRTYSVSTAQCHYSREDLCQRGARNGTTTRSHAQGKARNVSLGLRQLPVQRMDAAWPRRSGVYLLRCYTAFAAFYDVRRHERQRWQHGDGSLHNRASTVGEVPHCLPAGDVYQPTQGWWLLVTFLDETTLVLPTTLLMFLKILRIIEEPEDTLCFHLADIYREKFLSQHWLQLIRIVFCRQAKIHFLDQQSYTPEKPVTVLEALSKVHDWTSTNMGDRPLRRTVWQDRRAIFEHLAPQPKDNQSSATGKWLRTQPKTRPNYLPWITFDNTDILQAPGAVVLCCSADLVSYSATTRYVIREYGQENIFPLVRSPSAPWNNEIFLLCTRASNKHPLLHEVLHACLTNLIHQLHQNRITKFHSPMYDPERSNNLLPAWYATLRDHFTEQNLTIVLHDSVHVSIASVTSVEIGVS